MVLSTKIVNHRHTPFGGHNMTVNFYNYSNIPVGTIKFSANANQLNLYTIEAQKGYGRKILQQTMNMLETGSVIGKNTKISLIAQPTNYSYIQHRSPTQYAYQHNRLKNFYTKLGLKINKNNMNSVFFTGRVGNLKYSSPLSYVQPTTQTKRGVVKKRLMF